MAIGNPITLTSNVASKTISVIATAGQTLFTVTGGYRINQLAVFRNGVRLLDSRDYEARNGSTVTLLSAATVGDALEFQVFDDFRVADAIVSAESEQTISGNLTVSGILTATDLRGSDVTFRHVKATGISTVSDTTQSTTTTTGALIVSGGLGVAKNLFVGGSMNVAGTLTYEDVTNSETAGVTTTGGLVVTGLGATFGSGVGIADSIYHIDDSNTAIRFPAADTFTVETGGSERIRFTSGPTIGIGDNSPNSGETLVVARSGSTPTIRVNGASSFEAQLKLQADGTATDTQLIAAKTDGALAFSRWTGSAYAERLRIESGGDVGIGTNNPNRLLQVEGGSGGKGQILISTHGAFSGTDTADLSLRVYTNSSNGNAHNPQAQIQAVGGGNYSAHLLFKTAPGGGDNNPPSERVRIVSGGNVGIATTNPLGRLSLLADDTQADADIVFQSSAGIGLAHAALSTTDDSGGTDLMVGSNFYLSTNGAETRFNTGRSGTAIRFGYSGTMRFYTNSGSNAPTERLRIDSSGRLLVGVTASQSVGFVHRLQVEGTDAGSSSISLLRNSNDSSSAQLNLAKTRGTSTGSNTIVQDDDSLGEIKFRGADGTDKATEGARITASVDGTPGENDMPGRLTFWTTADGANSPTERLRITSAGRIGIGTADPQAFLVVQGNSNDSTLPSIRLQDGTDARQVQITNTSGDFLVKTCGSDNNTHGSFKIFESGIIALSNGGASGSNVERLRIDVNGNFIFKNGALIENGFHDDGGGMTGDYNHDLGTYGNVHYAATNPAGSYTYNLRINSSTSVNSVMAEGDTLSFTFINNISGNTGRYMTAFKIDGTTQTVEWAGGSAPSENSGSGSDVYSFTIIKTADATFKVFGSFTNHD